MIKQNLSFRPQSTQFCLQKCPHPTARPVDKCDVQWFSVQEYKIINKMEANTKDFALSETLQ